MGARVRAHDWIASPLGRPSDWPSELKTLLSLILVSRQPMFLAWGAQRTWFYNDAFIPILGNKHPDAFGRPALDVWAEARSDLEPLFDRVFGGTPVHLEDIDLRLERDGKLEEAHFSFSYNPVHDERRQVLGLFGVCVETTSQVLANRALLAQHERFAQLNASLEQRVAERTVELRNIQTFYTHSSECHAVLSLREDGAFQYDEINPATLRLYGMAREQVIGRTVVEVLGAERAAELQPHLAESLRSGAPHRYVRRQNDSAVEAIATPIPVEPNQPRRLAVTARDVSEQHNLEAQLRQAQKMEAVGQLTGGLAHDFNNLLGAVMGSLELLETSIAQGRTGDFNRYVTSALTASKRAAALTHRLLAFSRRQTLDPKSVNINRLVTGMAELIRRTAGPEIQVEVVSASDLWLTHADASQLENSLLNLCINARDAMPHGGRLTIETANRWIDSRTAREHDLRSGQYISMCVSDTGSGMSPEIVARAFDPFFTTKPTGSGTGLGLSMVYGFAKQSGGQVRIYSEVGHGTMVCIYLPRHIAAEESIDVLPPPRMLAPAETANGKILVVDDESNLRMVMTDILTELGYEVIEAQDGQSAMRVLDSGVALQLLVTDVGLPGGMNGRQIADAARARLPQLKVLFVTGYAENAAIGSGIIGPGMQVMTKPFSIEDFVRRVKEMDWV